MKKYPEIIFLGALWLCEAAVFPVIFSPLSMPRLILAGLVVLAMSDESQEFFLPILLVGLWLDNATGLLFGSHTFALVFFYEFLRYAQKNYFPSSYRYFQVIAISVLFSILMDVWIWGYGLLASKLGWIVSLHDFFGLQLASSLRLFTTGVLAFVLYVIWQEISHFFHRPIGEKK